jgi:hypothetical protein
VDEADHQISPRGIIAQKYKGAFGNKKSFREKVHMNTGQDHQRDHLEL